ncbi:hypothetical protein HK100_002047 [Physocladia obscura]|uniref:CENP-V/GFA domain-containing protein n=1 Tax=Physocladia obscura TaxID=109957 RepID=A0AAD5SXZ0_9FUNG|nr:hypothetical protein HK100_002047 [Physocladia obscura]
MTLRGSCFCKFTIYTISLPSSASFPLEGYYSHSEIHRRLLGFPTAFLFSVPSSHVTFLEPAISRREYTQGAITAVFCGVCGASLLNYVNDVAEIHASTLDVEEVRKVVVPTAHVWCVDSSTLSAPARFIDDGLPRFAREAGGVVWDLGGKGIRKDGARLDVLAGGCCCGGVRFEVERPPEDYLDNAVLKEWTKRGRRYTAGHCFCISCRQISGAPFWDWMFVPRMQIKFLEDSTIQSIVSLQSNERDVTRRFCGVCGTHLFFTTTTTDYMLWDVAIGALDSSPLPDDWLVWKYDPRDNEDARVELFCDKYINGWLPGRLSFEDFAAPFCGDLLQEVRKGLGMPLK